MKLVTGLISHFIGRFDRLYFPNNHRSLDLASNTDLGETNFFGEQKKSHSRTKNEMEEK